jgi:formylglycine-generating enzyme required for sulfatase activity
MHPGNPSTHLLSILLALVAGLLVSPSSAHAQAPCASDLTDDGVVDAADLGEVLNAWGPCGKSCGADIDGDGAVTGEDMAAVLNSWGTVCPQIAAVSPSHGPSLGGTLITITGANLAGVAEVTIGGTRATAVSVIDDATVTAVTPAGTPGSKDVSLTTPTGTASLANGFTHTMPGQGNPSITRVAPTSGPNTGGAFVEIFGANLWEATVTIGGVSASIIDIYDGGEFGVVVDISNPATSPGWKDVTVTTPQGSTTISQAFEVIDITPTIVSVNPPAAPSSGGTTITIAGNYVGGWFSFQTPVVTVGGVPATVAAPGNNKNVITAVIPPGVAGWQPVTVTTIGGTATLARGVQYVDPTVPAWATPLSSQPDPTVVTDPAIRKQIEAIGLVWSVRDDATGMEMVLVPAGTYEMGCTPSNTHGCFAVESPVHTVTISRPMYVGRNEVTQAQWTSVMGSNPSRFTAANGFPGSDARPVESVSWTTVQGFLSATGHRLPTEAEWEYLCRAGTTTAFHGWPAQPAGTNDDTQVGNIAWYGVNAPGATTQPVGTLAPNGFGIFDMAGNVSEWCSDWYSDLTYGTDAVVDPQGPASSPQGWRVLRGSNIANFAQGGPNYARSSCRNANVDIGEFSEGFRAVRNAFAPTVLHVAGPIDSTPDGLVVVPPAGGATITIYGQYLTNATSVTIGGSAAVFTAVNDNRITAIAPLHAAGGPFDLVVTTPDGSATEADVIYYAVVPAWAAVVSPAPDPSVVTSASLREAIVATGYAWHVRTNDQFSIEMIVIPPGSLEMGCSASQQHGCDNDESPVHSVTITSPYYIGRYEVTQAQWNMVNAWRNTSFFDQDAGYADTGSWPAEDMSWNAIVTGVWATEQATGSPVFVEPWLAYTSGLRLPTEAEWEYAYRAGTATAYHGTPLLPYGSNDGSDGVISQIAWCSSGGVQTRTEAVGLKSPNGFGLYDMGGNVAEWCNDWYGNYASGPQTDPSGPASGLKKVVRNGSWKSGAAAVRSSERSPADPQTGYSDTVGLRVVKDP